MEKNTEVNMSNESSAHNNINDIVLQKKRLDYGENNTNTYNNRYMNSNNNNNSNMINKEIKKEEFNQTNPNYHSGILERIIRHHISIGNNIITDGLGAYDWMNSRNSGYNRIIHIHGHHDFDHVEEST